MPDMRFWILKNTVSMKCCLHSRNSCPSWKRVVTLARRKATYLWKPLYGVKNIFELDESENVCYLFAKKVDDFGCIALRTAHGKHLAEFKRKIIAKVGYERIELVTLSRPSAYVEYEPYHFVDTEEAFLELVEKMQRETLAKEHNGETPLK